MVALTFFVVVLLRHDDVDRMMMDAVDLLGQASVVVVVVDCDAAAAVVVDVAAVEVWQPLHFQQHDLQPRLVALVRLS